MKLGRMCYCGWLALFLSMTSLLGANPQIAESSLTEEGRRIEAGYAKELEGLRSRITKRIPFVPVPTTEEARKKEFDFPEVELGGKKKSGDIIPLINMTGNRPATTKHVIIRMCGNN